MQTSPDRRHVEIQRLADAFEGQRPVAVGVGEPELCGVATEANLTNIRPRGAPSRATHHKQILNRKHEYGERKPLLGQPQGVVEELRPSEQVHERYARKLWIVEPMTPAAYLRA